MSKIDADSASGGGASLETVRIMGVDVHRVSVEEAVDWIVRRPEASDGRTRFVAFTGFHGLWVAQKDLEFARVLDSVDLFCPDGIAPI